MKQFKYLIGYEDFSGNYDQMCVTANNAKQAEHIALDTNGEIERVIVIEPIFE